jgi:hypothetical protein
MIAKWDTRHLRRATVAFDRGTGRWTVGRLLAALGMDQAWVIRYSSAAGRAAAKAYRAATGHEPGTALTLRHGRIRRVMGYASLTELLAAVLTYKRLATELGI